MKKFKIFLITLSLVAFPSFVFATEENSNNISNNIIKIALSDSDLNYSPNEKENSKIIFSQQQQEEEEEEDKESLDSNYEPEDFELNELEDFKSEKKVRKRKKIKNKFKNKKISCKKEKPQQELKTNRFMKKKEKKFKKLSEAENEKVLETANQLFSLNSSENVLNLEKEAKKAVKKINFDDDFKNTLIKNNILFYKRNPQTDSVDPGFVRIINNQLIFIPYSNFVDQTKKLLLEQFKEQIRNTGKINYSEIKIFLPEDCIFFDPNFNISTAGYTEVFLAEDTRVIKGSIYTWLNQIEAARKYISYILEIEKNDDLNQDFKPDENDKFYTLKLFVKYLNDSKTNEKVKKYLENLN